MFRNSEGKVLQFCTEVCADLPMQMELLAVLKGILVVVVLRWISFHSFLFEFDSQSVVA